MLMIKVFIHRKILPGESIRGTHTAYTYTQAPAHTIYTIHTYVDYIHYTHIC